MLEKLEFDVSRDKDGGTIMRVVDSDDLFDITIEKNQGRERAGNRFSA